MKLLLTFIARLSLVLTVLPAFLHLMGWLSLDAVKWIMGICTLTWFVSAPMLQRIHEQEEKSEAA